MNKEMLRKKCKEKISHISPKTFEKWGEEIFSSVTQTEEWEKARTVFIFVSFKSEADTTPLLLGALRSGKRLCVPKITGKRTMVAVEIKSLSDLKSGKFGIFEPIDGCRTVEKSEIDLAILPCLAADEKGHRLGRGGGFYDRFCENLSCAKIAICPEMLLTENGEIPIEGHDVSVDKIATEKRIIEPSTRIDF